jgi:N4-gp56 family major capsid protein
MPNAYTSTSTLENLVQTAYDTQVRMALRSTPLFRAVADTRPAAQSMPGSSVVFNIHQNLDKVTQALDEIDDPSSVNLKNTTVVTVTLQQYGNHAIVTDLLQQFAFDGSLDMNAVSTIAYNQADSVDAIVAAVLDSGDNNVIEDADGKPTLVAQDDLDVVTVLKNISAKDIRYVVAKLRGASVVPVDGKNYVAFIHPNVAADFRSETDSGSWSAPHEYVDTENIYAGEIGIYAGVRFVETSRTPISGTGETAVYTTFVVGKEALAEAVADEFHVELNGTVVDPLNRKMAIGWKGTAGWAIFRPEALYTIKTLSTIV